MTQITSSKSVALMKFLSALARKLGVGAHVYVVGGAVRNFLMGQPVKDLDVVIDSIALGEGRDSAWFASNVLEAIPEWSNLTTNQYGVAILTVKGPWVLDGFSMEGEVIEIANARKESYGSSGGKGKGYKPTDVQPSTIEEDIYRREFTFNTLLWRLEDVAEGPEGAPVIDITGLGLTHLKEKLIQTPLDPDRTFSDDPTRMLRAIKFLMRYDLRLSEEVERSIMKNASKMTQMPWEAVATILVRDILSLPSAKEALFRMMGLGLVRVLKGMVQDQPPFASYMAGQFGSGEADLKLLVLMDDLGLGGRAFSFLSPAQKVRFKALVVGAEDEWVRKLYTLLQKPPIRSLALFADFGLEGKARSAPAIFAREAILEDLSLVEEPERIEAVVREMLGGIPPAPPAP